MTVEEVERRLSWSAGRAIDAFDTLLEARISWCLIISFFFLLPKLETFNWHSKSYLWMQEGLAMIDDGHKDGKRRYWFPCVSSISTVVGADSIAI